jgi:hypothetical protein
MAARTRCAELLIDYYRLGGRPMTLQNRRFSNKQVALIAGALCLALGLAPAGAVAVNQVFTIGDPVNANKARVNARGALAVTPRDATSGVEAKVDAGGHALVGDGDGPLTVNGSVQSVTPTATWNFSNTYPATYYDITPPKGVPVNLSTLFLGGDSSTTFAFLSIYAATTPTAATTDCQASAETSTVLWQGEAHPDSVSVTFGVPLRAVPAAGKRICLWAYLNKQGSGIFDVNGYYG